MALRKSSTPGGNRSGDTFRHRIPAVASIRPIFTKRRIGAVVAIVPLAIAFATWGSLKQPPLLLPPEISGTGGSEVVKMRIVDRHNLPLSMTYRNRWNIADQLPLWQIPILIRQAAVVSEDKRFYQHHGVDWRARARALVQNIAALHVVRGASTITEQVDRIINPRRRTVWSRWIEGFEAAALERRFSKDQLLECYLNQLPYSANRRGIVQAASYYFNRDLETLSPKEMLALVVLARAPSVYERAMKNGPQVDRDAFEAQVGNLALRMQTAGDLSPEQFGRLINSKLTFSIEDRLPVEAADLVRFVQSRAAVPADGAGTHPVSQTAELALRARNGVLRTTIDGEIQNKVNRLVGSQLKALEGRNVTAGAALVIDHQKNQILAWSSQSVGRMVPNYNNVILPRQPGSALKPFLYALALESGWTAATTIADTPLARPVGHGLHRIRNYSNIHYGSVRLREALGNSLNVPAIRTVEFVGTGRLLERLKLAGFSSLSKHSDFYGEGLALGNGEVTLLELVSGYAALARGGVYLAPSLLLDGEPAPARPKQVFDPQSVSVISDILSDPNARTLEFGPGNILRFPVETAVKTGTSTDYRDAWAVGYSSRYTVGVWMGNLEQTPMADVTGSIGPALVLRAIFAELNREVETRALFRDPSLQKLRICRITGARAGANCPGTDELFIPGHLPAEKCQIHNAGQGLTSGSDAAAPEDLREANGGGPEPASLEQAANGRPHHQYGPRISQPTEELHLAKDPRIPDQFEAFQFKVAESPAGARIDWIVDGSTVATTERPEYLWPVARGSHSVAARVVAGAASTVTEAVNFTVK